MKTSVPLQMIRTIGIAVASLFLIVGGAFAANNLAGSVGTNSGIFAGTTTSDGLETPEPSESAEPSDSPDPVVAPVAGTAPGTASDPISTGQVSTDQSGSTGNGVKPALPASLAGGDGAGEQETHDQGDGD